MIAAEELDKRADEIKTYLAEYDVLRAIKRFMDFTTDYSKNLALKRVASDLYNNETDYARQAVMFSMRYNRIKREREQEDIGRKEANAEEAQLAWDLMETIDELTGKMYVVLQPVAA